MKGITKVNVYMKWKGNKIDCICLKDGCECKNKDDCETDSVTHDKYEGVEECFKQNRYGK